MFNIVSNKYIYMIQLSDLYTYLQTPDMHQEIVFHINELKAFCTKRGHVTKWEKREITTVRLREGGGSVYIGQYVSNCWWIQMFSGSHFVLFVLLPDEEETFWCMLQW